MPRPRKKLGTRQIENRLFIFCEGKKDKSESAKKHSVRIQKEQVESNLAGTPIYEFNPYTDLNELIDEIKRLQAL